MSDYRIERIGDDGKQYWDGDGRSFDSLIDALQAAADMKKWYAVDTTRIWEVVPAQRGRAAHVNCLYDWRSQAVAADEYLLAVAND